MVPSHNLSLPPKPKALKDSVAGIPTKYNSIKILLGDIAALGR